jgi:hypothetical protein
VKGGASWGGVWGSRGASECNENFHRKFCRTRSDSQAEFDSVERPRGGQPAGAA